MWYRPCGIRLGLYPLDIPLIENMARVAELAGVTTLVKFGELDTVTMWDVLDSVAKGILMPGLKNAAEVKQMIDVVRAAPAGRRRKNIWWGRDTRFGAGPVRDLAPNAASDGSTK